MNRTRTRNREASTRLRRSAKRRLRKPTVWVLAMVTLSTLIIFMPSLVQQLGQMIEGPGLSPPKIELEIREEGWGYTLEVTGVDAMDSLGHFEIELVGVSGLVLAQVLLVDIDGYRIEDERVNFSFTNTDGDLCLSQGDRFFLKSVANGGTSYDGCQFNLWHLVGKISASVVLGVEDGA